MTITRHCALTAISERREEQNSYTLKCSTSADPVAAAREFATKIYDVHLKDTEILWQVARRSGI